MYVAKKEPGAVERRAGSEVRCENEHTRDGKKIQRVPGSQSRIWPEKSAPAWTPGLAISQGEHVYRLLGKRRYTKRNGHVCNLWELLGRCAVCGALFICEHVKSERYKTRTCEQHRGQYRTPRPPKKPSEAQVKAKQQKIAAAVLASVMPPRWIPDADTRNHLELIHSLAAGVTGQVYWRSEGQVARSKRRLPSRDGIAAPGDVSGTVAAIGRWVNEPHRNVGVALAVLDTTPDCWADRRKRVVAVLGLGVECESLEALPLPPSWAVEVAPGHFEAVYALDRPLAPALVQETAAMLARATRCAATLDLARPWSILGLRRWPTSAEAATGWPTSGFEVRIARRYAGQRYSLSALRSTLEIFA